MKIITLAVSLLVSTPIMGQQAMKRVIEPNEHAYSLLEPDGWAIQGGIQRRSILQPHSVISLQSPGGATFILLGNPEAISYSTPTPLGYRLGFRDGSLYSPNGDPLIIRQYVSGQQFAVQMGGWLLNKAGCQDVRLLGSREKPALSANIAGVPETNTAGEAFFQCERNGIPFDAYMFSKTQMFGRPTGNVGAVWNADTSYFFVTPHGERDETGALLARIIASVQIDPQWYSQQMRAAGAAVAATAHRLDEAMATQAQSIRESFGQAEADRASTQDEFGRLISGFDEYQDTSGNRHSVPYAQATNWYSNGLGQVVGTQGRSPGVQWTEMARVPPGQ